MNSGCSIAHYRITAKLGEGGMGKVWRAIDTKLNRDVAIKILPEAFAQDADRMARFTRKSLVLASLNHPNIAAIYGVEEGAHHGACGRGDADGADRGGDDSAVGRRWPSRSRYRHGTRPKGIPQGCGPSLCGREIGHGRSRNSAAKAA
jgi:hypothetical protein